MNSLAYTIISIVYLIILISIYFSKKKINTKENKIYSIIIIITLISLLLEFSSYFLIKDANVIHDIKYIMINKFILISYIVWQCLFTYYVAYISKKNSKSINMYIKKYNLVLFLVLTFSFFLTLICPLTIVYESGLYIPNGISVDYTYALSGICVLISIIFLFLDKKNFKDRKYLPLYFLITLGSICVLIQFKNPELLLLTPAKVIICFIMYFTIENPDMKMIEQLNIAKEDAEKANRAKTDFLSSMSHEIRTPLNAIVGFSECLLQADDLSEAKENAEDIVVASKTLLEIVNSILDISKIEAGKIEIHNSSYKPNELFSEIEKLISARLGDKELEFRVSIAPDIPEVLYGDHSNIKKVIINLLTNALKYTDQGYFTFEVKCINKNKICRLMIDVKDTGRGIKKENLDKLFTKFQRLDEDRNTTIEGTGLGLAITKQLVEIMGGKIIVQSQYGEGSKFSVILDQQISNEKINSENVIVVDNLDLSGKKILVVDDNKLNIKVASKILSKYNLNIDSAESGMECLEKIKNGSSYDIIFMDDMMPRMNGGETLLRLKQIEGFKTPVIALTANAINGMKEKYLNQGFNDYLSKPIEKDELHQVLCKYLRDSKEEKNEIEKEEIVYKDYSNKKVLIVDDNKMNIKVASHIMKPYNFEIDEALSGEECLNIIKNKEYDLIFMDYMMPDMDGIETLKNLKKIEGFKTPVIALTADAVVGAREKFLKAGFDEYVSKPIIKESLNKAIDNVLNKN